MQNLTRDLIKIPSTKDNLKAKKRIVDFVIDYFRKDNVFIKRFSHNNLPSVVINLKKEKNPFLFLCGHLDVVPADKEDFIPRIKGSRLYGRGSGDMKDAVAMMMKVLKYFSKQKKKCSLGLILTTDEEIGGANGVGFLLKQKRYKSKLAFIPDGGRGPSTVVVAEKGILHLKIKVYGRSAHSSKPFAGDNAIEKLIKIYSQIKKIIPELKKEEWKNSLNLGRISGGEAVNKVPDYAEMDIDIRFVRKEDGKFLLKKIRRIVEKSKGKIEIISKGNLVFQDKDNVFIKKYAKIAEKELGEKILFIKKRGASDARYFAEQNIPVILTNIDCKNIHAKNEYMNIKSQEKLYKILIKFISLIC